MLWTLEGNVLKNKANLWQSNDQWNLTFDNWPLIYIRKTDNSKVLGINNGKVIEEDIVEGKLGQLWDQNYIRGDYFILQNAGSLSMVLSATSKSALELQSMWLLQYII